MLAISIYNKKGGVGKSLFSIVISSWFGHNGKKTTLLDLDPQGGSLLFASIAEQAGTKLTFNVARKPTSKDVDVFVFDHSPGIHSGGDGQLAPFVIIPTILDASSYSATLKSVQELREQGKTDNDFIVVPNRVEIQNKEQLDLLIKLQEEHRAAGHDYDLPFIKKRVAYPRSYNNGVTIFEEKTGLPLVSDARKEFELLMDAVGKKIKAGVEARRNKS
ncbi:ParA family protein [Escherichia coli]|uniref:Cobalamin biosynthesis protein CobQ n=1 Tax=Escherichia coli TaxID=562 RepID=A0AB73PNZ6_ECOLX|nr:ParA family protein [Escherichia coli]OZO82310.1 cobalamin biosynthesis protein CobQ [Escherichia coli]OZP01615.1 cobalamin biosynthesis protein CobQ [Escherichia coli]